jgi:hypothetical protein
VQAHRDAADQGPVHAAEEGDAEQAAEDDSAEDEGAAPESPGPRSQRVVSGTWHGRDQ